MGTSAIATAEVIVMPTTKGTGFTTGRTANNQWADCISHIAQQDKKAFAALFKHYAPQIKAYGLATNGVPGLDAFADELVQETMIKVWRNAQRFDGTKAGATTWVFTIARNARIDLLRRGKRYKSDVDADDLWLESDEAAPVDQLEQRRNASAIRDAISQLPIDQAQAISKVYLEGKSHSEVAAELQLPLGTVKSRVRLALSKMKLLVTE